MGMIRIIINFLLILLFRVKVIGKEHINGLNNGLVCANHTSWLDGVVIYGMFPKKVYPLAKDSIFKFKPFGWILKKAGVYPVNRKVNDLKAALHAVKIIKDNKFTLIFPEGTRNGMEKGERVKSGAIHISRTANCSLIPVYITEKPKLFHKMVVIIGEPIKYETRGRGKEYSQECADDLMKKILELRDNNKWN